MKKILFIMHMPPPIHGAAQMGQYIHDSKLINDGFECRYFNPSASDNVKQIGRLSIRKICFFFHSLWRILSIVKEFKPDLVYITPSSWDWGFYRDFITIWIIKHFNCKIVAHFHNKGKESFENKWYNKLIYHSFFKDIYVIFLSKRLISEFKCYLQPNQIFICPNGIVSTCENRESTKSGYNKQQRFNILFLSNMMEEKGVYVLLEACRLIKESGLFFYCNFVGNWADVTKESFRNKVMEYELQDNVIAHGPKYGYEKKSFFSNSNLLVFPTFYHGETFGLVLLEAMDYSLPVIGTRVGGIPDVIEDGVTGYIIEPRDSTMLAERIIELYNDREKAIEMGKRGHTKFEKEYTYQVFENKIFKILNQCIES